MLKKVFLSWSVTEGFMGCVYQSCFFFSISEWNETQNNLHHHGNFLVTMVQMKHKYSCPILSLQWVRFILDFHWALLAERKEKFAGSGQFVFLALRFVPVHYWCRKSGKSSRSDTYLKVESREERHNTNHSLITLHKNKRRCSSVCLARLIQGLEWNCSPQS